MSAAHQTLFRRDLRSCIRMPPARLWQKGKCVSFWIIDVFIVLAFSCTAPLLAAWTKWVWSSAYIFFVCSGSSCVSLLFLHSPQPPCKQKKKDIFIPFCTNPSTLSISLFRLMSIWPFPPIGSFLLFELVGEGQTSSSFVSPQKH